LLKRLNPLEVNPANALKKFALKTVDNCKKNQKQKNLQAFEHLLKICNINKMSFVLTTKKIVYY